MAATNAPQAADEPVDERETPSVVALDRDEVIRCINPAYDHLEWYYAFGDDGVVQYHEFNDFRPNSAKTIVQAEMVIETVPVAEVVDRGELVAAQRRVSSE